MSADIVGNEDHEPLTVAQLKIIELKEIATARIIELIEENLDSGTNIDELVLSAKESTQRLYKYLTEESPLRDDFIFIKDFFKAEDKDRYISEVVANVARYLLSSEDYNTKVQNSYVEWGIKRRKLPLALHLTLVECLPDCQGFTKDNRHSWNLEAIKLRLEEAAKRMGIEIDLQSFTKEYLHNYLRKWVFPFHPDLKHAESPIDDSFWEAHRDNLETFVTLTQTGYVRDMEAIIKYIRQATGVTYQRSIISQKFKEHGISIERSRLTVDKVNAAIQSLKDQRRKITGIALAETLKTHPTTLNNFCTLHEISYKDEGPQLSIEDVRVAVDKLKGKVEISWDSVAKELGLYRDTLRNICRQLNINIINEDEVTELIIDLEAQGKVATSRMVATELGYSFKTINDELGDKEGFKLSLSHGTRKSIERVKQNTQEPILYRNLVRAISLMLEANLDRVFKLMNEDNINIFTIEEIENSIDVCTKNPSENILESIASSLRTDTETLLRDLRILGYDLPSLGIYIEA